MEPVNLRRHRLETRQTHLQSEWLTRTEKLAKLREALVLATDVAVKFQLEKQVQVEQQAIDRLEQELSEIEQNLQNIPVFTTVQPTTPPESDRLSPAHPSIVPPAPLSSTPLSTNSIHGGDRRSATLLTRHQFLKWLGLGGVGVVGTVAMRQLLNGQSPQPPAVTAAYTQLEALLRAKQWQAADRETKTIMLTLAGREEPGWLDDADVQTFPCDVLETIDQLWTKYSRGRFGFSVQKKIYLEVGGKLDGQYDEAVWQQFGDRVGWRKQGSLLDYDQLDFSADAPTGQFPLDTIPDSAVWGIFARIDACHG